MKRNNENGTRYRKHISRTIAIAMDRKKRAINQAKVVAIGGDRRSSGGGHGLVNFDELLG